MGLPDSRRISDIIESFLEHKAPWHRRTQISFYGGNFLGLSSEESRNLIRLAAKFVESGRVDGIRFSTRPDTVRKETIGAIRRYPVETVEIGAQSMNDAVLRASGRGHSSDDTRSAVSLLRDAGYEVGLQMMVGLPGDTSERVMTTGAAIVRLNPDFVRIYPTLVLRGSSLARWYRAGRYRPLALRAAVSLVRRLYGMFTEHRIPVVRMGLQLTKDFQETADVLDGPYHPAFGHLVVSEHFLKQAISRIPQNGLPNGELVLRVHPRSVPKMRGDKNRNIEILKKKFHITRVGIEPDDSLGINEVRVAGEIP